MKKYSSDKNVLMLLSLMKQYQIRKVIASPGTTNIAVVGSMQHDKYFEIYSVVDERSAAYMACGLAAESGEAVAIVCTGATASRNYLPALTEAYYRKLPILVIAGSHGEEKIGHLHSQVIDRSQSPLDTVLYRAFVNPINNDIDEWNNSICLNRALISLKRHGGGPALVNIVAPANKSFDTKELPLSKQIRHYECSDDLPVFPKGRIAVFVGSHKQMSDKTSAVIDAFCASRDAVVFCDHTSGYQGRFRVNFALVCAQFHYDSKLVRPDLLIHIGEVSGDTYTTKKLKPKKVWRVCPDGELRDLFCSLDSVFEMDECTFFNHYTSDELKDTKYLEECQNSYKFLLSQIPSLEFGNLYVAKTLSGQLPKGSVIHFGIFNSLRSWNFFLLDPSIRSSSNVGGFGIDGAVSTLLGAAMANLKTIHFLVVGDLAFFYDMNSLGNRHIGNNVRILLVNNGRGIEFRKKDHPGYQFGESADCFIAAGGHFGNQSPDLARHYAQDLGFEYLSASSKEGLDTVAPTFLCPELTEKPILLEVFPSVDAEVDNLNSIRHMLDANRSIMGKLSDSAKEGVKGIIRKIR